MALIQKIAPTVRFMKMLQNACQLPNSCVQQHVEKDVALCSRHNLHRTDHIQRIIYHFVCDLCDADYVGHTARHLFQRVAEHKNSAIGKHFHDAHGRSDLLNESHFKVLRKCQGKFDCLVFELNALHQEIQT